MTTATKRAALYTRVSTTGQEEDGTSLDTQLEACRAYAEEHGYEVVAEHREVFSGAEFYDRPELTRLREAMRTTAFDVVISYAVDRLSRNTKHLGAMLTDADRVGVTFEFVTEKLEDTPEGRFLMSARAFVAEIEREKIRERSLRGKLARVRSGKVQNHGRELYGYRRDKERGVREVIEAEAAVVRLVFDMLAASVPMRNVVRRLEDQGVPSPSGNVRWARSQLHRMARNPAYVGEAVAWRYRSEKRNGHRRIVIRDKDEWVSLAGTTPAIVTRNLWQRVQDRLNTNTGEAARNATREYLLRGMVHCVCGQRMYAMSERDGLRIYRCSSRDKGGACGGKRTRAADLEAWAWTEVARVLLNPNIIAEELERRRDGAPDIDAASRKASLLGAGAKLERQQKAVTNRLIEAEEPELARQLKDRFAELQRERERLVAEVEAIDERAESERLALEQLDGLKEYCERVATNLDALDFNERRLALEALEIRVVANGCDWRLDGSVPVSSDGEPSTTS